jgi:putative cell wall-binding protein
VKMPLSEVLAQKITAFGADNVLVIGGRIEGDTISAHTIQSTLKDLLFESTPTTH